MKTWSILFQILTVIALLVVIFITTSTGYQWDIVWGYRQLFFEGWLITIGMSISSLFLSLLLGLLVALAVRSDLPLLPAICRLYVEVIRGTPLLVQILFLYYVVAHQVGLDNRYVAGIIILSLFHAAYIAEMIRAGLDTVSATQRESARAIGLSPVQAMRFVIFPQALRQVIPPLAGQLASIIKDSSLLSIIGINEVTNAAQQINSATYSTLESFFPLAIAYLILTLPISLWSKQLERRFQYET